MTPSDNGERKVAFLTFVFIIRAHVSILIFFFYCSSSSFSLFLSPVFDYIFFFHIIKKQPVRLQSDCDQLHDSNIPNIHHDFCAHSAQFLRIYFRRHSIISFFSLGFFSSHLFLAMFHPAHAFAHVLAPVHVFQHIFRHLLMFDFNLNAYSDC